MADPYSLLGVSKSASADEIKSAYRKLAKKLHPDLNPGKKDIEAKFKEVTAAYDLLSDKDKRAKFDRGEIDAQGQERGFGGDPFRGSRRGGGRPSGDPFSHFGGAEGMAGEAFSAGIMVSRLRGRSSVLHLTTTQHPSPQMRVRLRLSFARAGC